MSFVVFFMSIKVKGDTRNASSSFLVEFLHKPVPKSPYEDALNSFFSSTSKFHHVFSLRPPSLESHEDTTLISLSMAIHSLHVHSWASFLAFLARTQILTLRVTIEGSADILRRDSNETTECVTAHTHTHSMTLFLLSFLSPVAVTH